MPNKLDDYPRKEVLMVGTKEEFNYIAQYHNPIINLMESEELKLINISDARYLHRYQGRATSFILMKTADEIAFPKYVLELIQRYNYKEEIKFWNYVAVELTIMYSSYGILQQAIHRKFSKQLATLENYKTIGRARLRSYTLEFSMMEIPFMAIPIPLTRDWKTQVKLL